MSEAPRLPKTIYCDDVSAGLHEAASAVLDWLRAYPPRVAVGSRSEKAQQFHRAMDLLERAVTEAEECREGHGGRARDPVVVWRAASLAAGLDEASEEEFLYRLCRALDDGKGARWDDLVAAAAKAGVAEDDVEVTLVLLMGKGRVTERASGRLRAN